MADPKHERGPRGHSYAADNGQPDVALDDRPHAGIPFHEVMARRLARRDILRGAAGGVVLLATNHLLTAAPAGAREARSAAGAEGDSLEFEPIPPSVADEVVVPKGYTSHVVIRWGDSLNPEVPDLDTSKLAEDLLANNPDAPRWQENWFGYNNDAVQFFPLDDHADGRRRALLSINHEYTNDDLMFPNFPPLSEFKEFTKNIGVNAEPGDNPVEQYFRGLSPEQQQTVVKVMQAAHGVAIVEIVENEGRGSGWTYDKNSRFNRRITGYTPIAITGPAADHPFVGTEVLGTLNNCAGGKTPWGTYLTCEENFDQYFARFDTFKNDAGRFDLSQKVLDLGARTPLDEYSSRGWEFVDPRFDTAKTPQEPFKFGWVVELDPYDPQSQPKKRTALGRFKHEGATTVLAPDGRVVVYSGDDARFEYVYKFVSSGRFNPDSPEANGNLLDDGTLYVARYNDDGTGVWLPLVHGQNGLNEQNGFADQAEVLIAARQAGDILGATPMDRPEDIEVIDSRVYVSLTNNTKRVQEGDEKLLPNPQNPRYNNGWGHIMEMIEEGDDAAAKTFQWNIFVLCGNPHDEKAPYLTSIEELEIPASPELTYYAGYPRSETLAALGSPDNLGRDSRGNLWIVTDGRQPVEVDGVRAHDGCFAVPTKGEARGHLRRFASGPTDCEVCGAQFDDQETALFLAIQHPGDGGSLMPRQGGEPPTSNWPDGGNRPPRPSLVVVQKTCGDRRIGSAG